MQLHVLGMYCAVVTKMVQVRNVPDDVHEALRSRAAAEGTSLSELVLRQMRTMAARPSNAEIMARAARRGGHLGFEEAVESVHAGRRPDEA